MANLHLVTGFAGQEHVTAADQGSWNAAVMGTGQFVMGKGNQFAASVISNNQIRILDGEIMMHGRYIRLEPNTYVDLPIENGTQGYFRNDLVVARYTKTVASGIEEVNLVVIKGENADSNPVDPEHISGNILEGAVQNDLPLYRVKLEGLTVTGIEKLFDVIGTTLEGLQKEITEDFEAYKEDLDKKLEGHTHDGTTIGLSSETAAALGLDEGSNVDNALSIIPNLANWHVWGKYGEEKSSLEVSLATATTTVTVGTNAGIEMSYSDELEVVGGALALKNPKTIVFTQDNYTDPAYSTFLSGKYYHGLTTQQQTKLYYGDSAAMTWNSMMGGYKTGYEVLGYEEVANVPFFGYVSSPNENEYPKDGTLGEYSYKYVKALGEGGAKIETGSYTGTMTPVQEGTTSTKTIELGFRPKYVFIYGVPYGFYNKNSSGAFYANWGVSYFFDGQTTAIMDYVYSTTNTFGDTKCTFEFTDTGLTFTTVTDGSSSNRYHYGPNMSGQTYKYVAIG